MIVLIKFRLRLLKNSVVGRKNRMLLLFVMMRSSGLIIRLEKLMLLVLLTVWS